MNNFQPRDDQVTLKALKDLLEPMSVRELERFYRGMMNALTMAHFIFEQNYPKRFAVVQADLDEIQ